MPEKTAPLLFITLTLDGPITKLKSQLQLDESLPLVLKRLGKKNSWVLSAELTQASNIHYHAIMYDYPSHEFPIVYWNNKFKYKKNTKDPKIFGFSKIVVVKNQQKCLDYVLKEVLTTEKILGRTCAYMRNNLCDSDAALLTIPRDLRLYVRSRERSESDQGERLVDGPVTITDAIRQGFPEGNARDVVV